MDEKRLYRIEQQYVDISGIELRGRVLDIGGGGEGIIGQLKEEGVISIDPNRAEQVEAFSSGMQPYLLGIPLKRIFMLFPYR